MIFAFIICLLLSPPPPASKVYGPSLRVDNSWNSYTEQLLGGLRIVCTSYLSNLTLPCFLTCYCMKYHLNDAFQKGWPESTFSFGQKHSDFP